ncbi:MAG: hypothetical protein KatS3mg115_1727 [Candidatus Poribacteria bacterium]|nr:MAG: hypothetical protein KatS3mg115_1727 [Candidatus Poribacteria bacterium]
MRRESPGTLRNIQEIPRAIRRGEVSPLYVLFGQERYLLNRLVELVIEALLPESGPWREMCLEHLDGETATVPELIAAAETVPMGAPRRVLVLRDPAFLSSTGAVNPVALLRRAGEALEAGDPSRALELLYRALDVTPMPLTDPEFRSRLHSLREQIAEEDPDLLATLDALPGQLADLPVPESSGNGSDLETLLRWVQEGIPPTSVILFVLSEAPPAKLLSRLQSVATLANVDTLKEQRVRGQDAVDRFLDDQIQRAGKRIAPEAARLLRHRTADDLQALVDEIEKLIAYVEDREQITVADVLSVVSDESTVSLFDLTDAFGQRKAPEALRALHRLIQQGEPALKILAMLTRHVRLMLQAKLLQQEGTLPRVSPRLSYSAFREGIYRQWPEEAVSQLPQAATLNLLKQKPYACYVALRDANYYTTEELQSALQAMAEVDFLLKSSRISEHALLSDLLLRCLGSLAPAQTIGR